MMEAIPLLFEYQNDDQFWTDWRHSLTVLLHDDDLSSLMLNFRYSIRGTKCPHPDCSYSIWCRKKELILSQVDSKKIGLNLLIHCSCPAHQDIYEAVNLGEDDHLWTGEWI